MCDVCCEPFNKSNHKKITCRYCPFSACAECHMRYLLETTADAHCMSCLKAWSREILIDNFTLKFVNKDYKTRREVVLYEREKSLMPATQPWVETERKIRQINTEIAKKTLAISHQREHVAYVATRPLSSFNAESDLEASIKRHYETSQERKKEVALEIDRSDLEWRRDRYTAHLHGTQLENERRQFVRACPYENCRGFLSTAWKCGMCDNWTCPTCHEGRGKDKDAPHTCNEDSVATAKLLMRDSRPCPKCAAMIFKIDGCDQMYCTQCHTAFSWRRGTVETGTIHNPHYYEYRRAHGMALPRNPGDVPCGGFPEWHELTRRISRSCVWWPHVAGAHRSYGHCQWVLLPRYTLNGRVDNRDLRIRFMIGDFNEDEFKKKIQQREKAAQRKTDIRQIIEMYTNVLIDLFQAFITDGDVDVLHDSLLELRTHVNTNFTLVSKRYSNCAVPFVNENFDVV